jgi:hypothetical protein
VFFLNARQLTQHSKQDILGGWTWEVRVVVFWNFAAFNVVGLLIPSGRAV